MILITGAAGKTGRALVKAIRSRAASKEESIRVFIRHPDQIKEMQDLGVEDIRIGDFASQTYLDDAAKGVRVIYHIPPNVHPEELQIGIRMIQAASSARIERFVYHSVLHPQIEAMPHHWQKMKVEEALISSGLKYTILQPAAYMQNILANWEQIKESGIYPIPYSSKTKLGMVDLEDIATAAARVLIESGYEDAIYELGGPEILDQEALVGIISEVLNRPVNVTETSRDIWEKRVRAAGLADYQVNTLLSMFSYYERNGFWGNPMILSWLLGRQPTTFRKVLERWINKY
jgi:NAD(P)H dehydrogenase (quinone)